MFFTNKNRFDKIKEKSKGEKQNEKFKKNYRNHTFYGAFA